jgi:hypothetical protein
MTIEQGLEKVQTTFLWCLNCSRPYSGLEVDFYVPMNFPPSRPVTPEKFHSNFTPSRSSQSVTSKVLRIR